MTFRNYLGRQFQDTQAYVVKEHQNGIEYKVELPIIGIYFLGDGLETLGNTLAIEVEATHKDMHSGAYLPLNAPFVNSLTTKIYVFNLPAVRDKTQWRDELDMLLSLFDRHRRYAEERFVLLSLNEDDYSEKLRPVVRRLIAAFHNSQIKKKWNRKICYSTIFKLTKIKLRDSKGKLPKWKSIENKSYTKIWKLKFH